MAQDVLTLHGFPNNDLKLTANKMQAEMESPIASGADPFVFFAAISSAAEPKTTMTRTNVMKNSIPNP